MFKGIDLSSDTATLPTLAMKQAMLVAELGDEQKGEDPTTREFETQMAELFDHSAAMFFPSATMANEIAIMALCNPGDELIAAENCHLFFAEAGGPAIHAKVLARAIPTTNGIFSGEDIERAFNPLLGPHFPVSKLVSVENTTNLGGGIAWTLDQLKSITSTAQRLKLKLHMDGSRIFNAVVKTGLSPREMTKHFDTVTVCLSKGLGCPAGAILLFDEILQEKIRRLKQLMGGALRQSGMLAAAGIYALKQHIQRLQEDHDNAQLLAKKLSAFPEIQVQNNPPATNMVFFNWISTRLTADEFLNKCIKHSLRFSIVGVNKFRAVTHLNISRNDIERTQTIISEILAY